MEKTGLDLPMSERLMVNVVEQSEGRDRRGSISRTRLVCPGDTRHRHSASIYYTIQEYITKNPQAHVYLRGSVQDNWETP